MAAWWRTTSTPGSRADGIRVAQVALDHGRCSRRQVRRREAGAEVIQHDDLVASLEQRLDEVMADESGAAGDQDSQFRPPCLGSAVTWREDRSHHEPEQAGALE